MAREHFNGGGHKNAAGGHLLLPLKKALALFEKVVSETIDPTLLQPELLIDARIEIKDINPKLMRILKQFAPFGPGNMAPVFMAEALQDSGYAKSVGQEGSHLKLAVTQNGYGPLGGIAFNLGDKLAKITGRKAFDAVFSLDENEWQGNVTLQLKVRDIR